MPPNSNWHLGGFLTEGGDNKVVLDHNYVVCDAPTDNAEGGCTGDINLLGHFGDIRNITIARNVLGASGGLAYCTFGGSTATAYTNTQGVKYVNNVFERGVNRRCGAYGPVTDFDSRAPGNEWTNNRWETGEAVSAS